MMKTHFFGFKLSLPKGIDLDQFLAYFNQQSSNLKFRNKTRFLFLGKKDGFKIGLLLTEKGFRNHLETTAGEDGDLLNIMYETPSENTGIEFNFFVLNPTTMRGIYQAHRGSCGTTEFGALLKKHCNNLKNELIRNETPKEDDKKLLQKILAKLRKKYNGILQFDEIGNPKDFGQILTMMKSVSQMEYNIDIPDVSEPKFTPLTSVAKILTNRVTFDLKQIRSSSIKSALREWHAGGPVVSSIRITGISLSDLTKKTIEVDNIVLKHFGSMEHDEFSKMLPSPKWKDYAKSDAMTALLDAVKSFQTVFGTP